MKLGRALEVVRFHRKQLGRKTVHCAEPMCTTCALLAVAMEFQARMVEGPTPARRPARGTCQCGNQLIDGICSRCNG